MSKYYRKLSAREKLEIIHIISMIDEEDIDLMMQHHAEELALSMQYAEIKRGLEEEEKLWKK